MTNGWRQFGFKFKRNGLDLLWSFLYDTITARVVSFYRHPKKWRRRLITTSVIVGVLLVVGTIGVPESVFAGPAVGEYILAGLGYLLSVLAGLFASLLAILGWIFNGVVWKWEWFQKIVSYDAVEGGWKAVRDIANLSFVLILLGIGFATILRVPTYHVKRLIIPFVVALLLINFSKLICGVILDFCNVIMGSFAQSLEATCTGGNYSGLIAQAVGIDNFFQPVIREKANSEMGAEYFQSALAVLIFTLVMCFAFLMLIVLLVSRWVSLMVLTIFSPLAYAGMILPSTKGMVSKWWSSFLQRAFYGPAAVFMVWLAVYVLSTIAETGQKSFEVGGTMKFGDLAAQNIVAMILAVIILLKAVTISKSMGIAGAGAVISAGNSLGKVAGKGAWAGTKAFTRGTFGKVPIGGGRKLRDLPSMGRKQLSKLGGQRGRAADDRARAGAEGEMAKRYDMEKASTDKLKAVGKGGPAAQRVAATKQLAKNGDLRTKKEWADAKKIIDRYGSSQAQSEFKDAYKANNIGRAETDEVKAGAYISKKGVETQSNESLESAKTARLVMKNASRGQVDKMNKAQRKSYAKGLKSALDDGSLTGNAKIKAQREYARMSGGFKDMGMSSDDQTVVLDGMKAKDVAGLDAKNVNNKALASRVQGNLSDLATIQTENPEMGRQQKDLALKRVADIEKSKVGGSTVLDAQGKPVVSGGPSAEDKKFLSDAKRVFGSPVT